MALAGAIIGVAFLWYAGLARPETRNVRFLTVLGLLSVVIVAASAPRGTVAFIIELSAAIAATFGMLWPARVGLSSLDSADIEVDAILINLLEALNGPAPEVHAMAFRPALEGPPFATPGSPWRNVGRCYRTILARLSDADAGGSPDRTPLGAFRRAGRHYWQLALDRRVIGRPHEPSAWDEDVLVRCFLDEFDRLIPPGSSLEPSFTGRDGWQPDARLLIDELLHVEIRRAKSSANRRILGEAMEARLTVATGDHAEDAVGRMQATAAALHEQWQAPEEDVIAQSGRR